MLFIAFYRENTTTESNYNLFSYSQTIILITKMSYRKLHITLFTALYHNIQGIRLPNKPMAWRSKNDKDNISLCIVKFC